MRIVRTLFIIPLLAFYFSDRPVFAQPVMISIDTSTNHMGGVIGTNFMGLSFEVSQLSPDGNGVHYFRPDNAALVNLFQTLGVKSLRIGGNTSDRDVRKSDDGRDLLPSE